MIKRLFRNFEPNVEALILLVQALKVKVTNTTINETLQNHPEFPNLLSISDTLNKFNIENVVTGFYRHKIEELNVPFLALIRDTNTEVLVLVKKINEKSISYRKTIYQRKDFIKSKAEFVKVWSGIALLAEPSNLSGEKDFSRTKHKETRRNFHIITLLSVVFIIGVLSIINLMKTNQVSNGFVLGYSLLLLFKVIGVFITSLLIWNEIDKENPVLKKICEDGPKTDCNTVLNSRGANFFGLISWSDIGLLYFVGGFICLVAASESTNGVLPILAWLSVLAFPYTIFSVYYQWRIVKQWCILCLVVQLLLVFEFLTVLNFRLLLPINFGDFFLLITILAVFLTFNVCWQILKPIFLKFHQERKNGIYLARLKANKDIFKAILEKQKQALYSSQGLGVILGNPTAKNTLIIVSNLFCEPCSNAHAEIDKLLKNNPTNLKVQIIFAVAKNKEVETVIKHLLCINEKEDKPIIRKVLSDWYLSSNKTYESFITNYPINGELESQTSKVEAMDKWYKDMEVQITPTIFFNGYQLPDFYHIKDLDYILAND